MVLVLRFDLQPNIREHNPAVKRVPTVLFFVMQTLVIVCVDT